MEDGGLRVSKNGLLPRRQLEEIVLPECGGNVSWIIKLLISNSPIAHFVMVGIVNKR